MVKKSPLVIVEESPDDYKEIDQVLISAFETDEEMKLVNCLRDSNEYIHHLSTVAKLDGKVIGHCMMTKIKVGGHEGYLALAPVAVHESYQGKSVGSLLIRDSIKRADEYKGIVVLGHKDYYPKFGFELASKYGIECPFKVPDENYMYLKISDSDSGVVEYSKAFG
ncbi:N-acetyltransferase [Acidaminobacter sp. JC074]|nr:N-acetyltransferase [Acidaminobacter sp. JC074]